MDNIQMVDLRSQYLRIKSEVDAAIQKVLDTTAFIQGKDVSEFADALSKYLDVNFVVPCANGTDALQIAMMSLGFKPGDEVILPVHTYVATAEVIALLGLKPVFVDVDERTFNIDVRAIEKSITSKTVAIVPVHLYGQCVDMEPLLKISSSAKIHVIEDTAQALGSDYTFTSGKKNKAGTMGTIGTTSFFPSKNLGCFGDGGALYTQDESLAKRIKMISNHGQKVKYYHDIIGVNSRLDTLQAAILNVKIKYLGDYTQRRNAVAEYYDQALAGIEGLEIPYRATYSNHGFHQYTLKVKGVDRDAFKEYLAKEGVPSMIYYPVPLHLQQAYQQKEYGPGSFPVAESLSKAVISLPIHTEMTSSQLEFIADTVRKYFRK
ncbi:MAG: DegT/DnrJ/EryC1/StrS family aminotransferase [Chryseolinea sp.]